MQDPPAALAKASHDLTQHTAMLNIDEYGRAFTVANRLLHRPTPCAHHHRHPPTPHQDDHEKDETEAYEKHYPFVTLAVCSTSSDFFFPPPSKSSNEDDASTLHYHSVLRSHPPITGNYHHYTGSNHLSSAQVLEGYLSRIQAHLGLTPQRPFPHFPTTRRPDRRDRSVLNGRSPNHNNSQPNPEKPPPISPQQQENHQTITQLTSTVLSSPYSTLTSAQAALQALGSSLPRRVCQHPFKRHDIVWVCRTCQTDETCVLCHECFSTSQHEGHDVAFYHAQAGGCCDCGDPDAWDPKGFCPKHGGKGEGGLEEGVEERARAVVVACSGWLKRVLGEGVERGFERGRGVVRLDRERSLDAGGGGEAGEEKSMDSMGETVSRDEGGMVLSECATMEREDWTFNPDAASTSKSRIRNRSPQDESLDVVMKDVSGTNGDGQDRAMTPPDVSHEPNIFDPEAASTSKSRSSNSSVSDSLPASVPFRRTPIISTSPTHQLGQLGSQQHGLYIVLHADDIHSVNEISTALRSLYLSSSPTSSSSKGASPTISGSQLQPPILQIFSPPLLNHDTVPPNPFADPHSLYSSRHHRQLEEITYKIAHLFRQQSLGDLILYGTHELLAELGPTLSQCWKDGDERACTRFGALIMEKARILVSDHGLMVSIKTGVELWMEVRAKGVVEFLGMLSESCDPLCSQVSFGLGGDVVGDVGDVGDGKDDGTGAVVGGGIGCEEMDGGDGCGSEDGTDNFGFGRVTLKADMVSRNKSYLVSMLQSDLKLPQSITTSWHALLLTLLAVPDFKAVLANAYCDTYKRVTAEYAQGVGILEKSSYTLSVQFLNRVTYVQDLVRERDLLGCLGQSLLETLSVAKVVDGSNASTEGGLMSRKLRGWLDMVGENREQKRIGVVENSLGEECRAVDGSFTSNPVLDPMHIVLSHRRYSPCISDLKCVLNVPGMGRLFSSLPSHLSCVEEEKATGSKCLSSQFPKVKDGRCSLDAWIESLSLGQNMDGHRWRSATRNHVETESKGWVGAFNASISLGSLFERLLNWEDDDQVLIADTPKTSIQPKNLFTAVDLTYYVLTGELATWQQREMYYRTSTLPPQPQLQPQLQLESELKNPTPTSTKHQTQLLQNYQLPQYSQQRLPEKCCTASLPMSTIAVEHGTYLAMRVTPVAQCDSWSFHLPLHRFAAACLREVVRRPPSHSCDGDVSVIGIEVLLKKLMLPAAIDADNSGCVDGGEASVELLLRGLMEFPVIVLARAAQIKSGLWKRNGPGMLDQVLNYAEPPFCRALRDADLMLIQFALLGFNELSLRQFKQQKNSDSNNFDEGEVTSPKLSTKSNVGCAQFVNLLLHRLGIFEFSGLATAPDTDVTRYQKELSLRYYNREKGGTDLLDANKMQPYPDNVEAKYSISNQALPWSYTITEDIAASLSLFEEFFYALIVVITELPPPPALDMVDHTQQAKERLRREVVHRLVSGAKTHSELAEVHHVLPLRDNAVLSEEGKLVNPDDATGAALEAALQEVAERRSSRGRLEPDKWELKRKAWDDYDPAFFHISLRNHQNAAENRPKLGDVKDGMGGPDRANAVAYAPPPPSAHISFCRLRRDITADATVLALLYRTLHVHCRNAGSNGKDMTGMRGSAAYGTLAQSETVLARAIHLLTLGAYAWDITTKNSADWQRSGGGMAGSIFYSYKTQPLATDWISLFFLRDPQYLMNSSWYSGEENALLLLHRLAQSVGGGSGSSSTPTFCTQDASIRNGAKWLCQYATERHEGSKRLLGKNTEVQGVAVVKTALGQDVRCVVGETDLQRRGRLARERAMKKTQERMANFAKMFEEEGSGSDIDVVPSDDPRPSGVKANLMKNGTDTKPSLENASFIMKPLEPGVSSTQALMQLTDSTNLAASAIKSASNFSSLQGELQPKVQPTQRYLLTSELRCIICDEDCESTANAATSRKEEDKQPDYHNSNPPITKPGTDKILAFCGYAQASTILKGGGGVPSSSSSTSSVSDLVGTHVSLCGHVMHTSCCEAHLKDFTQRIDRFSDRVEGGKRGDFQCPMCRQLSNCLIPLISVGTDWIYKGGIDTNDDDDENYCRIKPSLDSFLSRTKWWAARNDKSVLWNGRSAFLRKGVKRVGKKDLYMAWTIVMKSPRPYLRKRKVSPESSPHNPLQLSRSTSGGSIIESGSQNNTTHPVLTPSTSNQHISVVTDVWRRVMDQFADVSYKADLKRLGETRLQGNYGEFRHYLVEKVAFNKGNRSSGMNIIDWPECIMSNGRYRRHELSRERLISKLLQSIQSFTYSCCAEEVECKRLGKNAISLDGKPNPLISDIFSKYGVHKFVCNGSFIILSSLEGKDSELLQPSQSVFSGRIGRLRYLGLAIMAATSVLSREIIQLSLDLPTVIHNPSNESSNNGISVGLEFEGSDSDADDRAPLVFPILCGHVLTHVVAAMCATCGEERAESNSLSESSAVVQDTFRDGNSNSGDELNAVNDCEHFIQLGFLARVLQVLLGCFQNVQNVTASHYDDKFELKIAKVVTRLLVKREGGRSLSLWDKGCCQLLQGAIGGSNGCSKESLQQDQDNKDDLETFYLATKKAKFAGFSFLCNAGLILQVIAPSKISELIDATEMKSDEDSLEHLMGLLGIAPLEDCMKTKLVQSIVNHWYKHARPCNENTDRANRLKCAHIFRVNDWPLVELEHVIAPKKSDGDPLYHQPNFQKYIQLLGGNKVNNVVNRPEIKALPISYTDLYAELTSILPDSELTAVCLVCGEVIDAGKGLCTKHAFECGGGCGIFFLLQECIGLIIHKEKAAYVHSPYVDSHGETPQYRGKRLNLELSRYNILHELWCGHMLRQEVISERSKSRSFLPNNFF